MTEPRPTSRPVLGIEFMWRPAVLAAAILLILIPLLRWLRTPPHDARPDIRPSGEVYLRDLEATGGGVGVAGARSKPTSALGKQGDTLTARGRVMNVFRMQKALVAVTEATVFIHATFADELPPWVQPGKNVQIEGRIKDVKTRTNIHVDGTKLTAMP